MTYYSYDRRASTPMVSPEYLRQLIPKLDPVLVADAPLQLERLQKSLEFGQLDPFPIAELPDYLRDRRVDEDEIAHVRSIKFKAPRSRKRKMNFHDAYLALEKALGISVIFDGRLVDDPDSVPAIEAWIKGFRKVKPKAKALFKQHVKKVKLRAPHGTEDASWLVGGVMALTIKKATPSPESAANHITHELGHAVEESIGIDAWAAPWGAPPFITDYAEMKPNVEDFAESFRVFIVRPSELRRVAPAKYQALRQLV